MTKRIKSFAWVVMLLLLATSAVGQEKKIILPSRSIALRQVFDEIHKQTNYGYVVDWNLIPPGKQINFNSTETTIENLLQTALENTDFSYKIIDGYISLNYDTRKAAKRALANPAITLVGSGNRSTIDDPVLAEHYRALRNQYKNSKDDGGKVDIVLVNFRIGKSNIDPAYLNNAQALDMIAKTFSDHSSIPYMDKVVITAGASPEGSDVVNERLSTNRALEIKKHIIQTFPYVDKDIISIHSIGSDWNGLRTMVEADQDVPGREDVLRVIDSNYSNFNKLTIMASINNGAPYSYINKNIMPYLRGGATCMVSYKEKEQEKVAEVVELPEPIEVAEDIAPEPVLVAQAEEVIIRKDRYVALKTNMLYDAVLIPNLGVEFSLGKRWSLSMDYAYSRWEFDSGIKLHRVNAGGAEVKKWLGNSSRTPLNGHFIGVYGMAGKYNVRLLENGSQSSAINYSAGITYGYSTPIARRLNLEFTLGVGYVGGEYKKYTYDKVFNCFPLLGTYDRQYFGPTKLGVSLVWLIGSGVNGR